MQGSHLHCGYSRRHSHFRPLHHGLPLWLQRRTERSPTPPHFRRSMAVAVSVPCLSPDYLRRKISGSVSCYAIFKGWLLLSQPPDCHRNFTSLRCTEHGFRDLNWRSGLFPFRTVELSPHVLTAMFLTTGIRSLIGLTRFPPIQTFQCSTPSRNT